MSKFIPEKVEIGSFEIKVFKKTPVLVGNDRCLGKYDPINFAITLDSEAVDQQQAETFIHEIIEATKSIYSLEIGHNTLSILAVGIAQALQPIWKNEECMECGSTENVQFINLEKEFTLPFKTSETVVHDFLCEKCRESLLNGPEKS